jgi:hypothetical protein
MNSVPLDLGRRGLLGSDLDGPAVLAVSRAADDVRGWAVEARSTIDELLATHHAILIRGAGIDSIEKFRAVLDACGCDLLEYRERSTPRSQLAGRVYSSTEYPKNQTIPMHNENSYSTVWPRRIFFGCLRPAASGGGTPIADSRIVFRQIDEHVRRAFIEKGVVYVRNYGQGVDLSWQDAFQTHDRAMVEQYCREADIACEWFDDGEGLHTSQRRPAALRVTDTGEHVWFNQAHLFHVSSLEPALRQSLLALFPIDRLPRHALFGTGEAIELEALNHIREVYARASLDIAWQAGDLLVLDNLYYAHGRMPFEGERQVVVAMDGRGGAGTVPL